MSAVHSEYLSIHNSSAIRSRLALIANYTDGRCALWCRWGELIHNIHNVLKDSYYSPVNRIQVKSEMSTEQLWSHICNHDSSVSHRLECQNLAESHPCITTCILTFWLMTLCTWCCARMCENSVTHTFQWLHYSLGLQQKQSYLSKSTQILLIKYTLSNKSKSGSAVKSHMIDIFLCMTLLHC